MKTNKQNKIKTYHNLPEFLEGRGFGKDEAHYWARCLYKYTDCGPWVSFIMEDGDDVYYEDSRKCAFNPKKCTGIKVGSIVEGSDVEIGPETLMFPFTGDQFDEIVKDINSEAVFYWHRDNSQWYELRTPGKEYYLHNTWGEIKWDTAPPPKALRAKVEKFVHEHGDDIPEMPGMWAAPKKDWKPAPIPGTKATIHEYLNDTTI